MTDHRAIAINKCRPWSSVFAARPAFDSSKKPCRTAFLGGQIEKMRKLQIPMSAPISGFSETGSQLTLPSSGESRANRARILPAAH
jgi:hypothetical protein